MRNLGIIIVNYNTKDVLLDCLKNLESLGLNNNKTIVIDNGSSDGSAKAVGDTFKSVDIIKSENRGLAAGYNIGLSHAKDCDFLLFMGTDAFPKPGCIEGVMDYLEEGSDVGVATAKLVLRNGSLDMDAHRGFPTPWTAITHFAGLDRMFPKSQIFNKYFMQWSDMSQPHEIDLCISHFMMVKKDVINKIGLWDEDFFVFGEDVDFCWRVKQAGFKIYYLPQFECQHYKGVSVGTRRETSDISKADNSTKLRMRAETTRAMKLFYKKHMYTKYPWLLNKTVEFGISLMAKMRR